MPLTILVVDDDIGIRTAVADYLNLSGYLTIEARDGEDALEKVDQYHPHLVIADIGMPRMTGYEFIQQLRRRPAFRLLPIILLTERTTTEERVRGYETGCDAYLPKPFELKELSAVVRNLLERSQLIQTAWQLQMHNQEAGGTRRPAASSATANIATDSLTADPSPSVPVDLTTREQEVLNLLIKGWSNAQIGDALHLSARTIEKYVSSLLRKTNVSNRAELVRFAADHNLI
ncbi:MAG: response regulator transcription factor [Elainellaceae cyanobacterium]